MLHRAMAVGLAQTTVVGFCLAGLASSAADAATNPPVPLVTNVVAQRVVGDVIQTLLRVSSDTNFTAAVNGSMLPTHSASGSVQLDQVNSNTNWDAAVEQAGGSGVMMVTNPFAGFVAGSMAKEIWAGFHTNGRSTRIWEFWQVPAGWPTNPPVLRWNTNNLMWGRKGMTAISQVCQGMGAFGQGAPTILTRRHAYVRGHSMGVTGLHPERVGQRIWYCTRDNQVIERKVKLILVRARDPGTIADYSIILFDADLPAGIEPMRVADPAKVRHKYQFGDLDHKPIFMALQGGYVSAGVPGWTVGYAGGDSGDPMMLPLPGELVFIGGITTSPPSAAMQADMDMLSRKAGLDPRKYQMQWVNLDGYPDF
jgi:hypothetical protein